MHTMRTSGRVVFSTFLLGLALIGCLLVQTLRLHALKSSSGCSIGSQFPRVKLRNDSDTLLIPDDDVLRNMNHVDLLSLFSRYTNTIQMLCKNIERVGNLDEGGKDMCIDASVLPREQCLVYSVGSNNQFDFEEDIIRLFGCDVRTFDPSMNYLRPRKIKNPKGCKFYNFGLADIDLLTNHDNTRGLKYDRWQVHTMNTILHKLGHTESIIDVLKIDIEGDEWKALAHMKRNGTLSNVRQLLVEFHFWQTYSKERHAESLTTFRHLYEAGFRIYNRERVIYPAGIGFVKELGKKIAYQVEICFININLL